MGKIAIVGGDGRVERAQWPKGYDLRFYQGQTYNGDGPLRSLLAAMSAGKVHVVIVLARWIGHGTFYSIKNSATCKVLVWDRGVGALSKELPQLLKEAV